MITVFETNTKNIIQRKRNDLKENEGYLKNNLLF